MTAPQNDVDSTRTEFNGFEKIFSRYLNPDENSEISWQKIEPLPKESVIISLYEIFIFQILNYSNQIVPYANIVNSSLSYENIRSNLNKLIVIKLNGGLGTSMGCKGPKSTITVRDDLTFLDLIIRQLEVKN